MMLRRAAPLLLLLLAFALAACDAPRAPEVTATPSPTATLSPTATASATPSATATPTSAPSPTTTPSATSTPAPTATPTGAVDVTKPPPGYEAGCASAILPWSEAIALRQPSGAIFTGKTFVCFDAPKPGDTVGARITARAWAAQPFEANLVYELLDANGKQVIVQPSTVGIRAPGYEELFFWWGSSEVVLDVPASLPDGPATIRAYFDSPRDGSVVAEASVSVTIRR